MKPAKKQSKAAAKTGSTPELKLLPYANTLGAYVNDKGVTVDEFGIAVDFKKLRACDTLRIAESLDKLPHQPADLLKAIAFDPRYTLNQRMAAAISAAPYFTAKKAPVMEGEGPSVPATPVGVTITFKDGSKKG